LGKHESFFLSKSASPEKMFSGEVEKYFDQLKNDLNEIYVKAAEFKCLGDVEKEFFLENLAEKIAALPGETRSEDDIIRELESKKWSEVIDINASIESEKNVNREINFLKLLEREIGSEIREVYFDLDETLVASILNRNGKRLDLIRPAAKILLQELKRLKIKISILTTRGSDYVPSEIRQFIDGEIIGRDEAVKFKEECFQRFGFDNVPEECKACFAKLVDEQTLIVDDADYAKNYDSCVHIDYSAKFFVGI